LNEADNKWIKLDDNTVNPSRFTVSGTVNHFTKFAVIAEAKDVEEPVKLKDLSGHWAEQEILKLVQLGVVNGYKDDTYRPSRTITRAEFVNMLVKALGLKAASDKPSFKDIKGHWAEEAISIAAANGIVTGFEDHAFRPDGSITREQMAVMVVKAFKLDAKSSDKTFTDQSDISAWAAPYLATATEHGILTGFEDGSLKPKGPATRAQAAVMVMRQYKE
jgi:hypothetical protein